MYKPITHPKGIKGVKMYISEKKRRKQRMYESNDKMVSHPDHYESSNGLKVIDVIEAFTEPLYGIEAADTANLIKYSCRWHKKNGIQDLEKIMWYAQHLIDHLKEKITVDEKYRIDLLVNGPELNPVNQAPSFNRDTTVTRYYDRITGAEITNPSAEQFEYGVATKEFVYDASGNLVNMIAGLSFDKPLNLKL